MQCHPPDQANMIYSAKQSNPYGKVYIHIQLRNLDYMYCCSPQLQADLDPRDRPRLDTTSVSVKELPMVHIKATGNNTIITITDKNGRTLGWTSAVRNDCIEHFSVIC